MITEVNEKPIMVRNAKAVRLAKERAVTEGRSAANAAAQSIIEWFEQKEVKPQEAGTLKNGS